MSSHTSGPSASVHAGAAARDAGVVGRYRWVICTLIFLATTVNYIDRQILALIKEFLDQELGWSNEQYGLVNSAFQGAYALGHVRVRLVHRPLRHEDRLRRVDHDVERGGRRRTRSSGR